MTSSRIIGFIIVLVMIFTNAACSSTPPAANPNDSGINSELETDTNSQASTYVT